MTECIHFVPFRHYDWTFRHVGPLQWNPTAFCIIAAFCGVALWMCIELFVQVYFTFKRHRGLYFWSIVITTWGLALQVTGYLLKNFSDSAPKVLVTIICKIGWISNVTGFSVVLYSRLHLVVRSQKILRLVLTMIITDAILFHTPVVVFEFGLISRHHDTYVRPMEIMERIQQTAFTCQETIISSLYIWHTARFLRGGYATQTRKVIVLLITVQSLVIGLDAGLTTFDYLNMFTLKCTIHPFVYSVKLKLEFVVLNQLLSLVKHGLAPGTFPNQDDESGSSEGERSPSPPRKRKSLAGLSEKIHWPWTSTSSSEDRREPAVWPPSANARHIMKTDDVDVTASPPRNCPLTPSASNFDHIMQTKTTVVGARRPSASYAPPTRQDSDTTILAEDNDSLDKVVEDNHRCDDIERQYLGRFGMSVRTNSD